MATINPITPVAAGIQPVPQMSLADMMNVARGAQQYQQAEQVNPLALQKAQMEIQQAQQINPLAVQEAQQKARTGQINLGVTEQQDLERKNLQQFFSVPDNFQTDGRIDINKINAAVPKIAPLTGPDYVSKITLLSTAQTEALKAKQNLTQDKKALIGSTLGLMGRAGVNDPNIAIKELQMLVEQNPNDLDLKNLVEKAYIPVYKTMQPGPNVADALIKSSQAILTPTQQQQQLAQTVQVTPEGKTVTTTPGIGGALPTANIGIAGGLQPNVAPSAEPIGAGAQVAPGMRVPYPVRRADQPFNPEPSEIADKAAGEKYRTQLINKQTTLTSQRRNIEEVINKAKEIKGAEWNEGTGPMGAMGRNLSVWLGTEQGVAYKQLSKDLANAAISNIQAVGGSLDTVAGQQLTKMANGDETYPPKVLMEIARRTQADTTNLDMQAQGAQQFAQRFGDNNMKAYQQAWNANADSKIFEAINIARDVTDPTQRDAELKKLFPDAKSYSGFLTKYRNLKKLSETGAL